LSRNAYTRLDSDNIMPNFKDHFSKHSTDYGKFRPQYPQALFQYLASLSPGHDIAWDSATGTGQAALGLSPYFEHVIATDASKNQIDHATRHPKIDYRVCPSEDSGIASASVDLIVVAQALHWFDLNRFFDECRRVLKDGGVIAIWSYGLHRISHEIDAVIDNFYDEVIGAYWPAERVMVEEGYAGIRLPFTEIPPPPFHMQAQWTLSRLHGYLGTWSAVQRYRNARGGNPIECIRADLDRAWGDDEHTRLIEWPLKLRVGIKQD
jgi:SAM-dependent methyltransferase